MHEALIREARARRTLPPPALRRAVREAAGLSQARCALEFEVDRATFSRWEGGQRQPRGTALVAYAEFIEELARLLERP